MAVRVLVRMPGRMIMGMVMRMPLRLIAALNVVMVRFLWQAHFSFKAQHLLPVLTIQAVHNILPGHALFNPVLEGIKH